MELPHLPPFDDHLATTPPKLGVDKPGVTSSGNPRGRAIHKDALEDFEKLTGKEQYEALRSTWKSVAMGLALRAKTFAATCPSKDFNKLHQLVQAGTISLEKAFPPREQTQSPKLIVNLFQSLGQRAARIAIPETPITVEINPPSPDKEINVPDTTVQGPA
jgi:hypothetical protein